MTQLGVKDGKTNAGLVAQHSWLKHWEREDTDLGECIFYVGVLGWGQSPLLSEEQQMQVRVWEGVCKCKQ